MPRIRTLDAIILLLSCTIATVGMARAEEIVTLRDIKVTSSVVPVQLEITADKQFSFSSYTMPSLLRGVIDLNYTEPGSVKLQQDINAGPVLSLSLQRKTLGDRRITRITFNLKREMELNVATDSMNKGRLLVTFSDKNVPASKPSAAPAAGKSNVAAGPASLPGKTLSPVVAPAAQGITAGKPSTPPRPAVNAATAQPTRVLQPVVPASPTGRLVSGIKFSEGALDIIASQRLDNYNSFTLNAPGRLVIDLPHTRSALANTAIPINRHGVRSLRIGSYPDKLRLVFDAEQKSFPPYELIKTDKGLRIIFISGNKR